MVENLRRGVRSAFRCTRGFSTVADFSHCVSDRMRPTKGVRHCFCHHIETFIQTLLTVAVDSERCSVSVPLIVSHVFLAAGLEALCRRSQVSCPQTNNGNFTFHIDRPNDWTNFSTVMREKGHQRRIPSLPADRPKAQEEATLSITLYTEGSWLQGAPVLVCCALCPHSGGTGFFIHHTHRVVSDCRCLKIRHCPHCRSAPLEAVSNVPRASASQLSADLFHLVLLVSCPPPYALWLRASTPPTTIDVSARCFQPRLTQLMEEVGLLKRQMAVSFVTTVGRKGPTRMLPSCSTRSWCNSWTTQFLSHRNLRLVKTYMVEVHETAWSWNELLEGPERKRLAEVDGGWPHRGYGRGETCCCVTSGPGRWWRHRKPQGPSGVILTTGHCVNARHLSALMTQGAFGSRSGIDA